MIAIVGGGLSGLFTLHELRTAGADAVLLEADAEVGGVVRTRAAPGGHVELGPARVRLGAALERVLDETALRGRAVRATSPAGFHVVRDGRMHPVPCSWKEAAATPLVSWTGKARALLDLLSAAPRPDETVAEAVRRKLGVEVYEAIVGPLLGGLYASDPDRMYARHTLLPMLEGAGGGRSLLVSIARARRLADLPIVTFPEGMQELPRALARLHADRVRTSTPVDELAAGPDGTFLITAGGRRVHVREVVLAAPADRAGELLSHVAPGPARRLGSLRYNPLAVVPMRARLPTRGSGFKVALGEPHDLRGVTAPLRGDGPGPYLTAYLGGMGRETLLAQPDELLAERAARDFERITGEPADPLLVHRTRLPAWDTTWEALEGLRLPPGIHLCAAFHGRPGILGRLAEAQWVARRVLEGRGRPPDC